MRNFRKNGAFTLIELMIVVSIIGLLVSVSIPAFSKYKNSAKLAQAYTVMHSLSTAQKTYYVDNNTYFYAASTNGGLLTFYDGEKQTVDFANNSTYDPNIFLPDTLSDLVYATMFGSFDASGTLVGGSDGSSNAAFKARSGSACSLSTSLGNLPPATLGINAAPSGKYDYYFTHTLGNFPINATGQCAVLVQYGTVEKIKLLIRL